VDESRAVVDDHAKLASVGEELADVLCYCLSLANTLQLDVSTILRDKLHKNASKYPAPSQS
jgi:NTP pyrophosphatase (non-canonical NTP hydrolase)